jgi:hypothetical protein
MHAQHYNMEASLYYAKSASSQRKALVLRRFAKAAEAIRYAVEDLSPELLRGCSLEVNESFYFGREIRPLYDDRAFPLRRRAKQVSRKPSPLKSTGGPERSERSMSSVMQLCAMPLPQAALAQAALAQAALAIEQAACRQRRVMAGYSFNLRRGAPKVRIMILKDISRYSDLGAVRHVSDLFEVLKQFDLLHPSAPADG